MGMTTDYYYKDNESNFISISGNDHKDFLQNLITNDIQVPVVAFNIFVTISVVDLIVHERIRIF